MERAQILEQQRNDATEAFKAQYEQKERDRLLLFDNLSNHSVPQLYRPVRGAIVREANPEAHLYSVAVHTPKNEQVLSVLRGHVVLVERMEDNSFTIAIQHTPYMSVYRHVTKPLKAQGVSVEAGEAIGLLDGRMDLELELWEAGQFVNPAEVIVW